MTIYHGFEYYPKGHFRFVSTDDFGNVDKVLNAVLTWLCSI